MGIRNRLAGFGQYVRLKGNEAKHEQTDAWSNRDLIPLPPDRRTWGSFNYYGFWAIASLNIANWQTPSTYLSKSLCACYRCRVIRAPPSVRTSKMWISVLYSGEAIQVQV